MKDFVQVSFMFPEHAKIFYVSKRTWRTVENVFQGFFDATGLMAEYEQQKVLQELVEKVRPELKNCMVYCLSYRAEQAAWDIAVSHPSLPAVPPGNYLDREPLFPLSWRDQPSMLGGT